MIIPIITAVSREVIRAVPDTQREAMLALGGYALGNDKPGCVSLIAVRAW